MTPSCGRLIAIRLSRSAPNYLWRSQTYYDWNTNSADGNGLLEKIRISTSPNTSEQLYQNYQYGSFANIRIL